MGRYKCKLCSKEFANGRALGGHMKSHFAILPIPPKTPKKTEQLSEPTDSSSVSFSEYYAEEREIEVKGLVYGSREKNPKRSFKLVDPKLSESGSVIEDTESETESSRNPTRQQRVKKTRKSGFVENPELGGPRIKLTKPSLTESVNELEEECVARCLMMLSRDTTWGRWSTDSGELRPSQKRYECETCKKVFRSFQALGGHRTSHRKMMKSCNYTNNISSEERVHKCPICCKVFGSGQALGGHKRSHFLTSSSSPKLVGACLAEKSSESLIDLNLPAPMEEEEEEEEDGDSNRLEVSAVSDAIHSH